MHQSDLAEIRKKKKIGWGALPPTGAAPLDPAYFRIEDPSRNILASRTYLAINPTMFFIANTLTTAKYKISHNSKTISTTLLCKYICMAIHILYMYAKV